MSSRLCVILMLLLGAPACAQTGGILQNTGFETIRPATPGADGLVLGWKLGTPPQVPAGWSLNSAYPGGLEIGTDRPHGGERFARITSPAGHQAHLFQPCADLEVGKWYRVTAWMRGGPLTVHFYEYFKDGRIGGQVVIASSARAAEWRQVSGFYRPGGEGYQNSSLALYAGDGSSVDVDDVSIEKLALPEVPAGADVVLETELLRLRLSPGGVVREFRSKPSGKEYCAGDAPFPILTLSRNGVVLPLHLLTREGDLLKAQFLDPEVNATLRVLSRKSHLAFEVVSVQPADVEGLTLQFPVKRLKNVAGAFNATYDHEFGACLFGTTINTFNQHGAHGAEVRSLGAGCVRRHGIVGAKFALVAAPLDRFKAAIIEAERQNGVPCPVLEGRWARDSEPARRSYLFMVDADESKIDKIIEYARVGKFGMIIFLKENWLANHGHFDVNTKHFPAGRESLKRAVKKIHDAGMGAGVHVFGPSLSPDDPYVTPRPDDRLATVPCPPLAEAVDEKAATLVVAGEPNLPPKAPRSQAFPDYYLRIGDEIIRYGDMEPGSPSRFVRCHRGALGTKAAAHPAGAEVKGLLACWGFFLVDPDSTLAEEVCRNFADVINFCDFDMVYVDASDGVASPYMDTWYYLNRMHLGFYRKFKKDVLYQTSMGTGSNLLWHIVPRSASADGHGDLKWYLDQRLGAMLGMAANFTRSDVGWYYMFKEVRPDQIEYVCAKTIGLDGSISIESSLGAMDGHPQARQMIEMVGNYEECRLSRYFGEKVREKLKEPAKDFKLFRNGKKGWKLYRALYEEPRSIDALDGKQNVLNIENASTGPCLLGVEVVRGDRKVVAGKYDDPKALTIESFDDLEPYRLSDTNRYEKFVQGGDRVLSDAGPVRAGVTQTFASTTEDVKAGAKAAVYAAENAGDRGGWGGIGRRFAKTIDIRAYKGLALWIHGDGKGEAVRFQLWDTKGRYANWVPVINYKGWRLHFFPMADAPEFDWSRVEYLLFYLNNIWEKTSVRVVLDDLKAIPDLDPPGALDSPAVTVNGRQVTFPVDLKPLQAVTHEGPGGTKFWPGGMTPGRPLRVPTDALVLQPGKNTVTFSADTAKGFSGDARVLLYRMWPLEE